MTNHFYIKRYKVCTRRNGGVAVERTRVADTRHHSQRGTLIGILNSTIATAADDSPLIQFANVCWPFLLAWWRTICSLGRRMRCFCTTSPHCNRVHDDNACCGILSATIVLFIDTCYRRLSRLSWLLSNQNNFLLSKSMPPLAVVRDSQHPSFFRLTSSPPPH